MSEVRLSHYSKGEGDDVVFIGDTVSEVLAMKADYLIQTVGEGDGAESGTATKVEAPSTTTKPSGFLSRIEGRENA